MANQLIAFHGKKSVKDKYVKRLRMHHEQDDLMKGKYWSGGKGCAVGCTIHGNSHAAYETEIGVPASIAHLEDTIFENLPNEKSKQFAVDFLEAIPVGADLSLVTARFMVWLLGDEKEGVIRFAKDEQTKAAINEVVFLYMRVINGILVTPEEWEKAAWAAEAAWAARAAARAAAEAAEAAWAEAAEAAEAAAFEQMSQKLIELLKTAPIKKAV